MSFCHNERVSKKYGFCHLQIKLGKQNKDMIEITRDGKVFLNGKEKKQTIRKDKCCMVWFDNKLHYVHRLVAEKYIPNPEKKTTVNHIDGDRTNNSVENLEWATIAENLQHARENGLWGENIINKRKLTLKQVEEIRSKYIPRKYTYRKLADEYGVAYRTVWNIINDKNYYGFVL